MTKDEIRHRVRQAIYKTIDHPDLAIGGGIETDHGTFTRLSEALTVTICASLWYRSRNSVYDQANLEILNQDLSSMIFSLVRTNDIYGYDDTTLIKSIFKELDLL